MKLYFITVAVADVYKILTAESSHESMVDIPTDVLHEYARIVFNNLGIPQPIGGFDVEELNERNVVLDGYHANIHITNYEEVL